MMVKVTMPDIVGATSQRNGWSKIARGTTVEKLINQCCGFEHPVVLDWQPVAYKLYCSTDEVWSLY